MKHKKKCDRPVLRPKSSMCQKTETDREEEFVSLEGVMSKELVKRMFTQVRIERDLKA